MTTWTSADMERLRGAVHLLNAFDHELAWSVGTQGISEFRTRERSSKNMTKWPVHIPSAGTYVLAQVVIDICALRGALR
jgi:hypothetical protein